MRPTGKHAIVGLPASPCAGWSALVGQRVEDAFEVLHRAALKQTAPRRIDALAVALVVQGAYVVPGAV
jgi:hypothetical protein